MVFNVHYNVDTSAVVSYQEGPEKTDETTLPAGIKLLAFDRVPDGFFDAANGNVLMKVENGNLVSIKGAPKPL